MQLFAKSFILQVYGVLARLRRSHRDQTIGYASLGRSSITDRRNTCAWRIVISRLKSFDCFIGFAALIC
jgi:hypothetical protein